MKVTREETLRSDRESQHAWCNKVEQRETKSHREM